MRLRHLWAEQKLSTGFLRILVRHSHSSPDHLLGKDPPWSSVYQKCNQPSRSSSQPWTFEISDLTYHSGACIQGQKGPSKMFDVCRVLLFENPLLGVGQRMINHMSAGSVSLMVVNKILHYAQKQNRRGKRAECRAINIFFQKVAANRKTSIFLPKNVKKNSQHAQLLLRVHLWVHKIFICA